MSTDLDILVNARVVVGAVGDFVRHIEAPGSRWPEDPLTVSLIATPGGTR